MATYDNNPPPQFGTGAFGQVPGATGMPPNTYQQLQGAYAPFMSQMGSAGQNITDELSGNVDLPSLSRKAAAFGIGSGMPGSGFQAASGLSMTQQAVQQMKRQGLQDYMGLSGMLGSMQTPQSTAIGLSQSNANLGAAPNPQAVYQQQLNDYMRMRNQNPAGGTGTYAPPPIVSGAAGGSRTVSSGGSGGPSPGGSGGGLTPGANMDLTQWLSNQGLDQWGDPLTDNSGTFNPSASNVGMENMSPWSGNGGGTYYDPATDTSNYDYGLPQWDTSGGNSGGTDWSNYDWSSWGD